LVKKKVRDVYGNWIWVDDEYESSEATYSTEAEDELLRKARRNELAESASDSENLKLDWRDYVALTLASLQTILLPIVIFILVIFGILIALAFLR
jgi:hypothetical protein